MSSKISTLSSSLGAQYVALQKKIGRQKVKTCWFCSTKWFWPIIFAHDATASKQSLTPAVDPVVDWLERLIGPGGLLLVVSNLFAVPVLVLRVRLGKRE